MHPCLVIPVFALVSSVACLDAYSFEAEFRPLLEERNSMLQNEQPSSLENMAYDRYLFDSSSKEGLYDELENPSNAEKYVSLWITGGDKNVQDDSKIFESHDVIQDLQDIQENTAGFPSLGSRDYFNRELFRPNKRSSVDLNKGKEKYLVNPEDRAKSKRSGHSLSIVNPLDVLRQRMLLDMARQRMAKNQAQIQINDSILQKLGKRSHILPTSSFARRGQLSSGEKSAQRTRRQRRDNISGKQVPAFEQLEV